jgi:hypothetical protein
VYSVACKEVGLSEKITVTLWGWLKAVQKSDLSATTKLVLFNLSIYMNDAGKECFPSTETQSKDTSLSERAVCTHLKKAVDAGFLIKNKRGFKGQEWLRNEYTATYPQSYPQTYPQKGKKPPFVTKRH